jgi:hypothetical protein
MPEADLAGGVRGPACFKQRADSLPTQHHHIRGSQAGSGAFEMSHLKSSKWLLCSRRSSSLLPAQCVC